jgi:hypothetical protein
MSPSELALAFILLTAPPGAPEAEPPADQWPSIQKSVHQLAMDWEILDKNETKFILARIDDFGKDLNILRRRYMELRDVPKVADCDRFPDRQTVADMIKFNRAYRKSLEARLALETDRAEEIRSAIKETDRLYHVWDAVRDARCDYYYVTVRRQALKKLKELIGEEAYAAGELPPNVPTWRFADSR